MEAVKAFDLEWKKQNSYYFLMYRFITILLTTLGICTMFIPIDKTEIVRTSINPLLLLIWGMHCHLAPYLTCVEEGKSISIYEKLKWMPVAKRRIQAVRREYMIKFCVKAGAAMFIVQQIGGILDGSWGIFNVLYPLWEVFFLFLVGIIDIYGK